LSILVVVAHPDDEVLGCGGTLLQMEGKKYLSVMTDGVGSRYHSHPGEVCGIFLDNHKSYGVAVSERQEACKVVASKLFCENPIFAGIPDNMIDSEVFLDVVKRVEGAIKGIKPTTILTHYEHDLNIDHRITYQAVVTACRPFKYPSVKQIYSFEIPSSTELASVLFKPDTFVDIKDTLLEKVQLFNLYKEDTPARNASAIETLARYRGTQAGCTYAEAFKTVRRVGIVY